MQVPYIAKSRKITPQIRAAQAYALEGYHIGVKKSEALFALKNACGALDLTGITFQILVIMADYTRQEDWGEARAPICTLSNDRLADHCQISLRTVKRHIKKIVEAGVASYRDSPSGRRYCRQDRSIAYGLDFSPVKARIDELKALAVEYHEECQEARHWGPKMQREFERFDAARATLANCGVDLTDDLMRFGDILCGGGSGLEKTEGFMRLADKLEAEIASRECEAESANEGDDEDKGGPESPDRSHQESPYGASSDTPYYNTTNIDNKNNCNGNERNGSDEPSFKNLAESGAAAQKALDKKPVSKPRATPDRLGGLGKLSLKNLMAAVPNFMKDFQIEDPSWSRLTSLLPEFALAIGLSEKGLTECRLRAGDHGVVVIIALAVEKHSRKIGSIKSLAGYVRSCCEKAARGEFLYNKSVFGLARSASHLGA